ncbi:hypothetical protein Gohar_014743 [Gossypium harknessii]|uniref:Uncharacterized protein n=1 Tax=Gossypium harknessii TaxID=34285 RepID=A0A7J9FYR8_9ROSI|nr:hypothetical protein [Gossypium harknessii]
MVGFVPKNRMSMLGFTSGFYLPTLRKALRGSRSKNASTNQGNALLFHEPFEALFGVTRPNPSINTPRPISSLLRDTSAP